jgi:methylenetetrahydrofolate dehydrogenase (NADP+) / methenyltetrahydrofolate cyclohydrolase
LVFFGRFFHCFYYAESMTHILLGAPVAELMQQHVREYVASCEADDFRLGYLAILVVGEDNPSMTYVRAKQKVADSLGIEMHVRHLTLEQLESALQIENSATDCAAIIVQLPIPGATTAQRDAILSQIDPSKDVDNLSGNANILGATPAAAMAMVDHYGYGEMAGVNVVVLGQSNLIGKPLAAACRMRHAIVHTCDITTPPDDMRRLCREAHIIFAATGQLHLVDAEFTNDAHDQIYIDIGRGMIDGKPSGDVDISTIADRVAAYSPVP